MPEPQPERRRPDRTPEERSADHASIDRLSGELLPALIAKLGATGLGELEVREGGWRVRLRRPGDGAAATGPATRERWTTGERDRAARAGGAGQTASHALAGLTPVGPGRDGRDGAPRDGAPGAPGAAGSREARDGSHRDPMRDGRIVATSPAVGIFQPRAEARAGTKVRAGDKLGSVDMLGIPQEVVAPSDGLVGATLVEPGDAVEYGQELILIEFASASPAEA
ncbi:MAG: Biotin-requiring enzyme [Chloroflexota bacterium]|nr:Biotin-requiring enzyme [Chloroflexota bacterium]